MTSTSVYVQELPESEPKLFLVQIMQVAVPWLLFQYKVMNLASHKLLEGYRAASALGFHPVPTNLVWIPARSQVPNITLPPPQNNNLSMCRKTQS